MIVLEHIAAVIAGLFLAGVCGWIACQCVKDTARIIREIREEKEKAD